MIFDPYPTYFFPTIEDLNYAYKTSKVPKTGWTVKVEEERGVPYAIYENASGEIHSIVEMSILSLSNWDDIMQEMPLSSLPPLLNFSTPRIPTNYVLQAISARFENKKGFEHELR